MVSEVRSGKSMRQVSKDFGVSLDTVQTWVKRANDQRLDRVDWSGFTQGGRRNKCSTPEKLEGLVVRVRKFLKEFSPLGDFGANAIREELQRRGQKSLPSVRTIGRILSRQGLLDGKRKIRRPAPVLGWYLPSVASRKAELDSFDFVDGLVIRGGQDVMVMNGVSLHGGLVCSFVESAWTSKKTVDAMVSHWRENGLPTYAQFDNDTIFQGPHNHLDTFGRVIRLCLQLGVIPVFAPPRETGFQAAVESYNGRWQKKVWNRFTFKNLLAVSRQSAMYVNAALKRSAPRRDSAPKRNPFPKDWKLDLQKPLHGKVIYLRRTNENWQIRLLGRDYRVELAGPRKLVRAEVDLTNNEIKIYRIRRADPKKQPLLKRIPYKVPSKPFKG